MPGKRRDDPNPVLSGIAHTAASLAFFSACALGLGAAVYAMGDADDAGPATHIALFEDAPHDAAPVLKARLDARDLRPTRAVADEPSLGVTYAAASVPERSQPLEQGDAAPQSVRINGHTVRPGQALSDVTAAAQSPAAEPVTLPRAPISGLYERASIGRLPVIAASGVTPAGAYARPFENPDGKPAVSVIVGGLGINYTHTASAIDELPPEITLSFVPHARNLQTWINRARAAGHEVLIEMPLEPYDYGRVRPHPQTLTVADVSSNANKVDWLLSRGTGYFGVVNYQGAKFATDRAAAEPMLSALAKRGVAFVEDGSLSRSVFASTASDTGTPFVGAAHTIDDDTDADAIEKRLLALEKIAKDDGSALAGGFAYPVTIDVLQAWAGRLEDKGLVLAPASALLSDAQRVRQVTAIAAPGAGDPAP
ncbi:MAG: divergent polysaccharide deacetylase family protein [Pseudomonadota bacterium]